MVAVNAADRRKLGGCLIMAGAGRDKLLTQSVKLGVVRICPVYTWVSDAELGAKLRLLGARLGELLLDASALFAQELAALVGL